MTTHNQWLLQTFRIESLYFAHPVNVFSTALEEEMRALIASTFPGIKIENPNTQEHQAGYERWKKKTAHNPEGHKGMGYYYEEILPHLGSAVAMPFLDGKWGSGVAGEVRFYINRCMPVWCIDVPQLNRIHLLSKEEKLFLTTKDSLLVLSNEETRARTWMSPETYGKEKCPYEEAHLVNFIKEQWTSAYLNALKEKSPT